MNRQLIDYSFGSGRKSSQEQATLAPVSKVMLYPINMLSSLTLFVIKLFTVHGLISCSPSLNNALSFGIKINPSLNRNGIVTPPRELYHKAIEGVRNGYSTPTA